MKLSIVIVHFNTPDLLRKCLKSIYAQDHNFQFEIIVIDNASENFKAVEVDFPQVKMIRNRKNLGFARANNQGWNSSSGEYVLFLNPDTEISNGSLERMLKFMELRTDIGILGPKLVYPDGSTQPSCRKFYNLRVIIMRRLPFCSRLFGRKILRDHLMLEGNGECVREADWLIAACIMVPRPVLEKMGGFDGGYKLYFEDVDLCFRIKKEGLKVVYYPESTVLHHHRRESARWFSQQSLWHILSALRFFRKYGLPL
jgi:GT2 family glycosyltransferase